VGQVTGDLMPFRMDEPSEKMISRTYSLPVLLVGRLNSISAWLRVWPSSLVAYLLEKALDQVDAGELVVPTKPAHRNIITKEG
jgi:hypothetical protein